jgi:hypothetical protein
MLALAYKKIIIRYMSYYDKEAALSVEKELEETAKSLIDRAVPPRTVMHAMLASELTRGHRFITASGIASDLELPIEKIEGIVNLLTTAGWLAVESRDKYVGRTNDETVAVYSLVTPDPTAAG